ncbi:hypothetical protein SASPL_117980 [Salvia splendens]|uniref:NB-ARC domain-containing protein n=1 Tax=Salvia splendens TaxID=180675 RepID=A0A8X8Y0S5_SALSN|nr:hypothetical protein SASPL_117980 [Salvia splendens]
MREMAFKNLDVLTFKLDRLLLHASLDPPTRQILESADNDVKSVAAIVARMKWRGLHRLEGEIENEAYKLLSKFESISSPKELKKCTMGKSTKIRSVSKLEDSMRSRFSTDFIREESSTDSLSEAVETLVGMVKKMEKDYADALYNQYSYIEDQAILEEEEESDDEVEMVGLSGEYDELKEKLFEGSFFQVLPVVGMAGIGKTTLCRKVFGDADVVKRFELRVWVRIGRSCELEQIPRRVLAEVGVECYSLAQVLKGKRCLIVLDDVWERNGVSCLHSLFGDVRGDNGSRVLVTTRLHQGDVDHIDGTLCLEELVSNSVAMIYAKSTCVTSSVGVKEIKRCGLHLSFWYLAVREARKMKF